jgi:Fur family transcriptional regulator, ferric uptake regulator
MKQNVGASAEVAYELSAEGFRMTELRRAILSIVAEQGRPFTIDEIRGQLRKNNTLFHLASLYRELDVLTEAGVIIPIYFHDHIKRYEFVEQSHHHHIVCIKCKEIADVDVADNFDVIEKRLEKKTKFSILRHSLEFFGLCQKCQSFS